MDRENSHCARNSPVTVECRHNGDDRDFSAWRLLQTREVEKFGARIIVGAGFAGVITVVVVFLWSSITITSSTQHTTSNVQLEVDETRLGPSGVAPNGWDAPKLDSPCIFFIAVQRKTQLNTGATTYFQTSSLWPPLSCDSGIVSTPNTSLGAPSF